MKRTTWSRGSNSVLRLLVCLACCLTWGDAALAAKITSAQIKNEGPLRLAGDTLMVSLLAEKQDKEIVLRVRAYSSGTKSGVFAPVMAKGSRKDSSGRLLVEKKLSPATNDLAKIATEFRIDGKDLSLPDGINHVQYEVAAVASGADGHTDVMPTQVWPVYVENGVRILPTDRLAPAKQPGRLDGLENAALLLKLRSIRVGLSAETKYKRWIYFATNRPQSAMGLQKVCPFRSTYSESASETLSYGVAETYVPFDIHHRGALDLGGWSGKNLEAAFTMKKPVLDYAQSNFFKSLLKGDVLVFIHGFNNSFEDAVVQSSQLRVDIGFSEFRGRIAAFSWPAFGGNVAEYRADGVRAKRSIPALAKFLQLLIAENAAANPKDRRAIHLIAHSMGNRVLLGALQELAAAKAKPLGDRSFGNVFLAAPDINAEEFAAPLKVTAKISNRVTVYYSSKDLALLFSELVHRDNRAGKTPQTADAAQLRNVDFICTDSVNSRARRFGHGYFAGVDRVLTDIGLVLHYGMAPADRRDLLVPAAEGAAGWAFIAPTVK